MFSDKDVICIFKYMLINNNTRTYIESFKILTLPLNMLSWPNAIDNIIGKHFETDVIIVALNANNRNTFTYCIC